MIDDDIRKIKYETTIMLLKDIRDNCYPMSESHKDAINIAIENTEYRIPETVCELETYYHRPIKKVCPSCDRFLESINSTMPLYCPWCGQALDYSEVTE